MIHEDLKAAQLQAFKTGVWDYYHDHARQMPWRSDPTPYNVFISEIMLQQTQVGRVREKYDEWLKVFPDFPDLAAATVGEVITHWQGLGYNRRALWTHRAAEIIVKDYNGALPQDPALLVKLPGIGPNTAGSLAAFAYNAPVVFIETNIRRVYIHHFFADITDVDDGVSDRDILPLIEATLDRDEPRQWYYALMDYGAHLAKSVPNPNRRSRHYARQSGFNGSMRQVRGEVLRQLTDKPQTLDQLRLSEGTSSLDDPRLERVIEALITEGFLQVLPDHSYGLA